jgi:hypothetical protein
MLAIVSLCSTAVTQSALAATEPNLERLVTCQESWLDWKEDATRMAGFANGLNANYSRQGDGYLVPKTKSTLFGLPVARIYPQSIGMAVGFSVSVTGDFAAAKTAVEKAIGQSLQCENDNDGHACQAERGTKKTVTVTSDAGKGKAVLIGCAYYYEK